MNEQIVGNVNNVKKEKFDYASLYNKKHSGIPSKKIYNSNVINNNDVYERNKVFLSNKKNNQKILEQNYLKKVSEKPNANEISSNLFENKKKKIFESIFNLLDSDGDGSISYINACTRLISKETATIIKPLLDELIAEKETLDLDEFCDSCNRLYQVNF